MCIRDSSLRDPRYLPMRFPISSYVVPDIISLRAPQYLPTRSSVRTLPAVQVPSLPTRSLRAPRYLPTRSLRALYALPDISLCAARDSLPYLPARSLPTRSSRSRYYEYRAKSNTSNRIPGTNCGGKLVLVIDFGLCPISPYLISGTRIAYGTLSRQDLWYLSTCSWVLKTSYGAPSAYAHPTRSPVLRPSLFVPGRTLLLQNSIGPPASSARGLCDAGTVWLLSYARPTPSPGLTYAVPLPGSDAYLPSSHHLTLKVTASVQAVPEMRLFVFDFAEQTVSGEG
eukprot:2103472-Rhodomonas_salina.2